MFAKSLITIAVAILVASNSGALAAQKQRVGQSLFGNPHTIFDCTYGTWDGYELRCDAGN
jgi:hypothetical protein